MTEPVSLAQVKEHLRLDDGDTSQDGYLSAIIIAARRACENQINRSVVGRDEMLELDQFPSLVPFNTTVPGLATFPLEAWNVDALTIHLPGGAVQSVDSITYRNPAGDVVPLDPASYREDIDRRPGRIIPVERWPLTTAAGPAEIKIFYTVAALDPDDMAVVGQAMLLLIEGWYSHRSATAVDTRGIPTEVPLAVTWLLAPLRQFATD